jgi:hypothetical protein
MGNTDAVAMFMHQNVSKDAMVVRRVSNQVGIARVERHVPVVWEKIESQYARLTILKAARDTNVATPGFELSEEVTPSSFGS